jgi:hypothetical protein
MADKGSEHSSAIMQSESKYRLAAMGTCTFFFCLSGFIMSKALSFELETHDQDYDCSFSASVRGPTTGAVAGGCAGLALTYLMMMGIGLSPLGPMAGGVFAASMGPAVLTGSTMAALQSAAMTGTAYSVGTVAGAAVGAAVGAGVGNDAK